MGISWPTSSVARERKYLADGLGAVVAPQREGSVLTDVYDFTPLAAEATMQFHVVERPANGTTGSMTWADFEAALQKCHKATIKDDLCGENTWMDHHMGLSIRKSSLPVPTDAETLKKLTSDLGLQYHITPPPSRSGGWGGNNTAVYVVAGNGLSITFQVPQGAYVPPRKMGTGMLDLCGD